MPVDDLLRLTHAGTVYSCELPGADPAVAQPSVVCSLPSAVHASGAGYMAGKTPALAAFEQMRSSQEEVATVAIKDDTVHHQFDETGRQAALQPQNRHDSRCHVCINCCYQVHVLSHSTWVFLSDLECCKV